MAALHVFTKERSNRLNCGRPSVLKPCSDLDFDPATIQYLRVVLPPELVIEMMTSITAAFRLRDVGLLIVEDMLGRVPIAGDQLVRAINGRSNNPTSTQILNLVKLR